MKDIFLIMGGGHCLSCIDVIKSENVYDKGIIIKKIFSKVYVIYHILEMIMILKK